MVNKVPYMVIKRSDTVLSLVKKVGRLGYFKIVRNYRSILFRSTCFLCPPVTNFVLKWHVTIKKARAPDGRKINKPTKLGGGGGAEQNWIQNYFLYFNTRTFHNFVPPVANPELHSELFFIFQHKDFTQFCSPRCKPTNTQMPPLVAYPLRHLTSNDNQSDFSKILLLVFGNGFNYYTSFVRIRELYFIFEHSGNI